MIGPRLKFVLNRGTRWFGSVGTFILFWLLLYLNWNLARHSPLGLPSVSQLMDWKSVVISPSDSLRLRLFLVPRSDLLSGDPISEAQLDWRLGWLRENETCITKFGTIAARLAATNIAPGVALRMEQLSLTLPGLGESESISFPVAVDPQHASSLKPGMRLALVNSSTNLLLESALTNGPVFRVLRVNHDSKDGAASVILSVPTNCFGLLTNMANAQWRPAILPTK